MPTIATLNKYMGFIFWNGPIRARVPTTAMDDFNRNAAVKVEAATATEAAHKLYHQAFPASKPVVCVQIGICECPDQVFRLPMAMMVFNIENLSVNAKAGDFALTLTGTSDYHPPSATSEATGGMTVDLYLGWLRNRFRFTIQNKHISPLLEWFRLHADKWTSIEMASKAISTWWKTQRGHNSQKRIAAVKA